MINQILLGIILSISISLAAWRFQSLSQSGALAAFIIGCLIFGLGGLPWAALLLTFFISSSLLSRLFSSRKRIFNEKYSKDSQRDWGQVLANGGLGAGLIVLQTLFPQQYGIWIAYIGAMAAVNADTWATELGVFSHNPPRLITNGKIVERGTSGGITLMGYLAASGGALLVALTALPFSGQSSASFIILAGVIGGIVGASFDSWLGATIQAIYFCPACQKETERHPTHTCGAQTRHSRGFVWLNNDWVNFACSLTGALSSSLVYWLFFS
ncbi:MAG: DUF92 domain-containing protein [Anaerolineales bacterium]|nr:DUF92 domain-containing protein [Anaerolineales bacterium]